MNVGEAIDNLSGQLHGQDAENIENLYMLFERSANTVLSHISPVDTMRETALSQVVHDDIYIYTLPSDYKDLIDLFPQDNRNSLDSAKRGYSERFSLGSKIKNKQFSIEGREGTKIIRIDWKSRQGKVLNTMDSITANGTWDAVGTATGLTTNTIFKMTGNASVEFDIVNTGDGIKNTAMTSIDMTDEDEVADVFVWMYFGSVANLTSISARWGNDVTSNNYWSSTAQTTQADGTAFQAGWNLIKFSWSSATETGTVSPSSIDSFQITCATSGAISNVRVDNIIFSIGRNFDLLYYSKYMFRSTSGTWKARPTDNTDIVCLDSDAIQMWHLENLILAAQESQSGDSGFDLNWARQELLGLDLKDKSGLYAKYRSRYPNQSKKAITSYTGLPRLRRNRYA